MNIFTNDDYRRIQAWLKANAIKDSDLVQSETTIPDEDILTIVQKVNGIPTNFKINIKDFLNSSLNKTIIELFTVNAIKVNNSLVVDIDKIIINEEENLTLQAVFDSFNNQLNDVSSASKGWNIEYQAPSIDEPTVRAKYVLKDYKGVPKGDPIKVYKDSAITNVYLGTTEDTCNENTGEVTKKPVQNNNEALSIVYRLDTGKYSLVNIPIGIFIKEAEFDKYRGLGITENGQVFIKLANDVESSNYLHFNASGEISADGIENRILQDLGTIINSVAGDDTMWGQYKKEEGTKDSATNEASRWGQYKQAEADRNERLNNLENKIEEVKQEIIYDVSAHNSGAVFESLSALLSSSDLNTLIPTSVRHGGMTIKFIQGSEQSSDNKYAQYRLMANVWSTTVADWQGIDDEPTAGSNNLVKSGGTASRIYELDERTSNKEESNNKLDSNSFVGKEFKEFNDVPLYLANGKTFADIMSETQKFCVKVVTEEGKISGYAGYFNLLDANGEVVGNNYSYFNIGVTNGGITDPSVLRGIKFHWYAAEHYNIAKYIAIVKDTAISPDLYEERLIPIESRHLLERAERLQETKVDKQEGKSLSSNDFTNNDKKNIADLQKELFVEKVVSNNFLDTRDAIGKTFAEINEKPFYIGEGLTMKDLFDKFGSLKLVIDGGVTEYAAYLQAVDKDGNNVGNTTTIKNDFWFGYGHFADYSKSIFGFKLHTYIASQGLVVNTFGIMTDRSRDNDTYQSELKSRTILIDDSIKDIKTEIPTINARLDNLEKKTNKIVCIGDSLTTNYPKQLEYPYDRIFCGGEDSIANLSRVGGIAINNKTDIVIPSSGSTLPFEICSAWRRNNGDNRELNFSVITPSNPYYRIGTVKMAGVEGTIDKVSVDVYGLLVYDSTNSIVARQKSNANFTLPSNAAYIKVCINSPYSGEPHLTIAGDDKHIVSLCSNEGYLKKDGSVSSGAYKYSDAIPVIGGQSVYADNLATGNMYVFTRNADGEEVVCGAYSDIYSHIIKDRKNESFIIMTGQNGGWEDADDLVNQIASSVVNIEKYLVVCTYTERTTVDVLKKMREKFGEKFFDLKTFMKQQSVYEAKRLGLITEGEQKDWRNIFIQDSVHPNIIGDKLWAKVFTNKLIELGYL